MAKICAIIPMYNFGEYTKRCIDLTLENAGVPIDILVVDDCSDVPFKDDRVEVLRLDENVGFTGATNAGILDVWGAYDYVLLLNNDTEPRPDFVKELLKTFDQDEDIGVACSVRETVWEGKFALFNQPVDCFDGYCIWTDESLPEPLYYCPWIPLCSALIRTDVLKQVGLLDRRMLNHCSDNDFCVRCIELGYAVVLVPKSIVFHFHEVTVKSLGIDAMEDKKILIEKVRCDVRRKILSEFSLTGHGEKKYELVFREKASSGEVMPNESQKTG